MDFALDKSFGCDNFFLLLANVKNKDKMVFLLTTFLQMLNSHEAESNRDTEQTDEIAVIQGAMERMKWIAQSLLCLLSPFPSCQGSLPKRVEQLMKYKGTNSTLAFARDAVSKTPYLMKLWDEVLAKQVSTTAAIPKIVQYEELLAKEPVDEKALEGACKEFKALKKACRSGVADKMEAALRDALHSVANRILKEEGGCSMAFFTEVQNGLQLFTDAASFAVASRLTKLGAKVAQDLWAQDALSLLSIYPEICEQKDGARSFFENSEKLASTLQKAAGGLKADLLKGLERAAFWHLRECFFWSRAP